MPYDRDCCLLISDHVSNLWRMKPKRSISFAANWIIKAGWVWLNFLKFKINYNTLSIVGEVISRKVVPTQATATEKPTNNSSPKVFIYLTQTEQCLPSNLASSSEIGDPETCHCDVIVLSFRTKCQVQKSPHITYLFDPNTGWGTGRNVLYFAAMKRSPKYHYYIFMDEDVVLSFNSFASHEMTRLPPYRVVEQWLLDYEPVVGVLDYGVHHGASWTNDRRRNICNMTDSPLVIPTIWFDGVFNAFHFKAIEHLFPYRVQYEKISWWSLHRYIWSAVELIFRGQALMFVAVTAGNPTHRSYPKSLVDISTYWRDYIDTIREEAPLVYRDQPLFEDFRQNLENYVITSSTYCMTVIRHQPIKPYSHFDSQTEFQ